MHIYAYWLGVDFVSGLWWDGGGFKFMNNYIGGYMRFLVMLFCSIYLCGCSVGMALSGKPSPELGAIRVGATRGEVELHLGRPVEIKQVGGQRIDTYEYEIGNEPSAGRAIGHGVMDVLTLGLWEVVGTPVEGVQGEKKRLAITYDEKDKVTNIGPIAPPPRRQASKNDERE